MSQPPYSQRRSTLGLLVLALPILSVLTTGGAYALMMWYGVAGHPAEGPVVRLDVDACPEAEAVIRARVEAMGLPDLAVTPRDGGFAVQVRLPADPRTHASIPATLTAPGTFAVRPLTGTVDEDLVLASEADIELVSTYVAFLDAPKVLVQLSPGAARRLQDHMGSHPDDKLGYWLDGRRVTTRRNMPPESRGQITLDLADANDMARMDFAAGAGIELEHGPMPCPVALVAVTAVNASP